MKLKMKKRSKKPETIRVCVKIPGRVKNVEKAIEMLGGEEALVKVSSHMVVLTDSRRLHKLTAKSR